MTTPEKARAGQALDEALENTFPASDPIACSPKQGGKNDKRVDVAAAPDAETSDAKTAANMKTFHKAFERRRR